MVLCNTEHDDKDAVYVQPGNIGYHGNPVATLHQNVVGEVV